MMKIDITRVRSGFHLMPSLLRTGIFRIIAKGSHWFNRRLEQHCQCRVRAIVGSRAGIALGGIYAFALSLPAHAVSFQGLGDLSGGSFTSQAKGISANGSTVVGYSASSNGTEAFRWNEKEGMVGLGDLRADGQFSSAAYAVSGNGTVVVGSGTPPPSNNSWPEGFRWTEEGEMVGLGHLGLPETAAYGVSDDGNVVVGYSDLSAFRWTAASGIQPLEIPANVSQSQAHAVSADGRVAVGGIATAAGGEAVRWVEDGSMQGLGDLQGGGYWSLASAVSATGQVIAGSSESVSGSEAFLWTEGEGMQGLGDLEGGGFYSEAADVSANGKIVVGNSESTIGKEAFIWDSANGMRSLLDLLVGAGLDLTGWVLSAATAISADGLTIAGNGANPYGQQEAWLAKLDSAMVVPEIEAAGAPAALATLIGGLLLIGERSRSYRSRRDRGERL